MNTASFNPKKRRIGMALGLLLLIAAAGTCLPVEALAQSKPYLMLKDRLDRPQDGYCIDIAGSADWINVNVPLSAHNCKGPNVVPDQAVQHEVGSGRLRFPMLNVCMTALGRAGRSLPQIPLLVQPCTSVANPLPNPFASSPLQAFDFRADGWSYAAVGFA